MYAPASSTSTSCGSGCVGEITGVAGTLRKIGPSLPSRPDRLASTGGANARCATPRRCSATGGEAPNMPRTSSRPIAYNPELTHRDTVMRFGPR